MTRYLLGMLLGIGVAGIASNRPPSALVNGERYRLVLSAGDGGGVVATVASDGGLSVPVGQEAAALRTCVDLLTWQNRPGAMAMDSVPWPKLARFPWGPEECLFFPREHRPLVDVCDGAFRKYVLMDGGER